MLTINGSEDRLSRLFDIKKVVEKYIYNSSVLSTIIFMIHRRRLVSKFNRLDTSYANFFDIT